MGGSVVVGPGGNRVLTLDSLMIDANGKLDLSDNAIIIRSGDIGSWNGSAYTGVMGLVASGRGDGSWNGTAASSPPPPPPEHNDHLLGMARGSDVLGIAHGDSGIWRGQT